MQVGEFLVNNREYSTACWQCYDRYLSSLSNGFNLENIQNLEDLRKAYFEGGIQNNENSDVIFRALMGMKNLLLAIINSTSTILLNRKVIVSVYFTSRSNKTRNY